MIDVDGNYRGSVQEQCDDFWDTGASSLIDKVTIKNLDIALRMVGIKLDNRLIDKIIDLVELIENKGDNASIKDVIDLQEEWVKYSQTFNNKIKEYGKDL